MLDIKNIYLSNFNIKNVTNMEKCSVDAIR